MNCKKCGAKLESPYIYCPKCFQPVEDLATQQNFHSFPMPKNIYQTPQSPLNKHSNKDLSKYPTQQNPFNAHSSNLAENFNKTTEYNKEKNNKKPKVNRKNVKKYYMNTDYSASEEAVKITYPLVLTLCSIVLGNIVLGIIALLYVQKIKRYNVLGNFIKAKQVKKKIIKYDIIGVIISVFMLITLFILGVI